jgi:hypothetical protein
MKEHPTTNNQRRTSNVRRAVPFDVGSWMLDVGCFNQ